MEFQTSNAAVNYVNNLKIWKKMGTYNSAAGHRITYRCTAGEYRKNECLAQIYLLFHSDSQMVSLYETQNEHDNHKDGNRGLSTVTKEVVCQLFNDGIRKPNGIIAAFRNRFDI